MKNKNLPNNTTSYQETAPKRLFRASVFIPAIIVFISIGIALFGSRSYRKYTAIVYKAIQTANELKMTSTLEHVEEYLQSVYSDLLYISHDSNVKSMNDGSRAQIQALFDHQYDSFKLSEIYIMKRNFNGSRRPFMTFEQGADEKNIEEIHSLEREKEEYSVLQEQVQAFITNPKLKAQISHEIRLCLKAPDGTDARGLVYSVPIHQGKDLVGIAAAMVPVYQISKKLELGNYANMAFIVNERGDIYSCHDLPKETLEWFGKQFHDKGASDFFNHAPGVFSVGKWISLWTPAKIISDQKWWLVFQYDERFYLEKAGFGEFVKPWMVLPIIPLFGVVIALLIFFFVKRFEERIAFLQERKKAEEELKKAKDYLENIIETSLSAIVITDPEGCIDRVNDAYLRMLGYESEEIIGKHTVEMSPREAGFYETSAGEKVEIGEGFFNGSREMVETLFEQGKVRRIEGYSLRKDGNIVITDENSVLLYNEEKELAGAVSIIQDITEQKMAEQKREKLLTELQGALSEVRTLSGLLPICASCKKIRDDKGYWNQIEGYISEHSGAVFSHGICPECAKKLYPDVDIYEDE